MDTKAFVQDSISRSLNKYLELHPDGGGPVDAYTKAETDALLDAKQDTLTAGSGIDATKLATGTIDTKGTPIQWKHPSSGSGYSVEIADVTTDLTDFQSRLRFTGNVDDVEVEFYDRLRDPKKVTKNVPTVDAVNALVNAKQDILESGTNIKTIDGQSILGSGDIPLPKCIGSGWGVAKIGSVTLTSQGGSHIPFQTIDITDLGLSSTDDYEVLVTVEGNRSTSYRVEDAFAEKISATQFEVAFYTEFQEGLTVNVSYAVLAKGYGSNISGWGVAKVGEVTGTFDGDWLQGATVDISSLGFNSVDDYDVYVRGVSNGSAQIMPYINSGRTATSFQIAANKNGVSVTEFTVSYVVIGRGFGGGTVDASMSDTSENAVQNKVIKAYVDNINGLPGGGTTGQILARNTMSPYNAEWIDNPVGILESPNGTKYRLIVADDGTLSTEAV